MKYIERVKVEEERKGKMQSRQTYERTNEYKLSWVSIYRYKENTGKAIIIIIITIIIIIIIIIIYNWCQMLVL